MGSLFVQTGGQGKSKGMLGEWSPVSTKEWPGWLSGEE